MSEILRGVKKGMHAEKKQVDHKRSLNGAEDKKAEYIYRSCKEYGKTA